ncbi:MAG: hypothetical protein H6Q90_2060 [Deltaproteobacteria bacterium]|nr:hypothetical protein [Deltaproteobacteria bacterium]
MRRMNRVLLAVSIAALAAGCGRDDSGEPIDGTIAITVSGETITPDVGAAIDDPDDATKALVILGTRDISCSTRINSRLAAGTYLTFAIDRTMGTQAGFISVIRVEGGSANLNGSPGEVIIDGIADRVTGSLTFDTTDDQVGPITATGTFDVRRCF